MEVTTDAVEHWLRQVITARLLEEPYTGADPLADHTFDSLALEELIDLTEEQFGILLGEEEIARENFSSLSRWAEVVVANIATSPWLER